MARAMGTVGEALADTERLVADVIKRIYKFVRDNVALALKPSGVLMETVEVNFDLEVMSFELTTSTELKRTGPPSGRVTISEETVANALDLIARDINRQGLCVRVSTRTEEAQPAPKAQIPVPAAPDPLVAEVSHQAPKEVPDASVPHKAKKMFIYKLEPTWQKLEEEILEREAGTPLIPTATTSSSIRSGGKGRKKSEAHRSRTSRAGPGGGNGTGSGWISRRNGRPAPGVSERGGDEDRSYDYDYDDEDGEDEEAIESDDAEDGEWRAEDEEEAEDLGEDVGPDEGEPVYDEGYDRDDGAFDEAEEEEIIRRYVEIKRNKSRAPTKEDRVIKRKYKEMLRRDREKAEERVAMRKGKSPERLAEKRAVEYLRGSSGQEEEEEEDGASEDDQEYVYPAGEEEGEGGEGYHPEYDQALPDGEQDEWYEDNEGADGYGHREDSHDAEEAYPQPAGSGYPEEAYDEHPEDTYDEPLAPAKTHPPRSSSAPKRQAPPPPAPVHPAKRGRRDPPNPPVQAPQPKKTAPPSLPTPVAPHPKPKTAKAVPAQAPSSDSATRLPRAAHAPAPTTQKQAPKTRQRR